MKTNYLSKILLTAFCAVLIIACNSKLLTKSDSISGTVFDQEKQPAEEVEITNLSNNFVTVSDENGNFEIKGKPSDNLKFKYSNGFSKSEVIEKRSSNKIYYEDVKENNIGTNKDSMYEEEMAAPAIEEVVVTGAMGIKREAKETASMSTVTADRIAYDKSSTEYSTGDASIKAGQLTAGEVNDFSNWEYWKGLTEAELKQWKNHWKFNPTSRYSVILKNQDGYPVINKTLHLVDANKQIIWTAKTDNTGRAELWFKPNEDQNTSAEKLSIMDDAKKVIVNQAVEFHNGINFYEYKVNCDDTQKVNIAFMVDATGSMGDEISYLQAELYDVIERTKKALPKADLTMGSVFYRDAGDEYVVKNFDFTSNISAVTKFIKKQSAGGGGDYPEAVVEALDASINQINWDEDAQTKLLFVLLDAPPHHDEERVNKLQQLTKIAAEKGIRIIPVAASGIDKSTEFLMRAIALETNGTYLFITNHSGIGNHHIEPSTDSYKVEMLNDLIYRIILQFSEVKDCKSNSNYPKNTQIEEKIKPDTNIKWSFYPNPTPDFVTIDLSEEATELYVFDTTGKIVFYKNEKAKQIRLDFTQLPIAIYYLKVKVGDKELFGKIIKK